MNIKEIANKVLLVMDTHEKSFVPGKLHGWYQKTIRESYEEVFGKEAVIYEPYYLSIHYCWNDMEWWANLMLKQ